ncbi:MAG: hypothetical protein ACOX5R_00010 [bacterium]
MVQAALFRVKDWLRSGSDYSDGIPHPRLLSGSDYDLHPGKICRKFYASRMVAIFPGAGGSVPEDVQYVPDHCFAVLALISTTMVSRFRLSLI